MTREAQSMIAIIGAGMMGEAIISGLLRQQLIAVEHLRATEPRAERRHEIHQRYGIRVDDDNAAAVQQSQVIVLAVKPQVLPRVLPPLQGLIPPDALVLSIAAGVPIQRLRDWLAHPLIVRAMPNTPARIGAGITVWTATPEVGEAQRAHVRQLLQALGSELAVPDEATIDMATALAGSGPAYIFLIIEAMIDAGVHLGLSRQVAEMLTLQMIAGSVQYAQVSGEHPAQLRNAVTSPGGTTAAALSALEQSGLRSTISDAIWAAYRRAAELGQST
ncbi:MAG: pyrroline-5-carboxylate reductase [Chloroflexaceae bacterium]|nr:pyrroline-5-carboxylate reductase [Chloroflexaceae bacterium]